MCGYNSSTCVYNSSTCAHNDRTCVLYTDMSEDGTLAVGLEVGTDITGMCRTYSLVPLPSIPPPVFFPLVRRDSRGHSRERDRDRRDRSRTPEERRGRRRSRRNSGNTSSQRHHQYTPSPPWKRRHSHSSNRYFSGSDSTILFIHVRVYCEARKQCTNIFYQGM